MRGADRWIDDLTELIGLDDDTRAVVRGLTYAMVLHVSRLDLFSTVY